MSGGEDLALQAEVWRPVIGYEGLYEVSDLGRVRSLDRIAYRGSQVLRLKGAIKSPGLESSGYLQAKLTKDGVGVLVRVNRLVAMHFIANPDDLPEVNHIDLDKLNNAASNLEWSTHKRNMEHAGNRGRLCGYLNKNKRVKLCPDRVAAIREAARNGGTHRSIAKEFGVASTTVGNIIHFKRWNPEILELAPRLIAQDQASLSQRTSYDPK